MIYVMAVPAIEVTQDVAAAQSPTSSTSESDTRKLPTYCIDADDASRLLEIQGDDAYNVIPASLAPMGELGYKINETSINGDFLVSPEVRKSKKVSGTISDMKKGVRDNF